ncbi:hypothetical protein [Rhodococcus qingshengii]|uniref:hypothetical protein n=1 Tax=Rhodococcus qingshengii TaxID=334542 RepID=UPI001BE6A698|nr:hypothetical protein [Rhodococcus qingshengii]MBT2274995.1 hypothetical protein [Rhodococcus qingshengii]
MTTSTIPTQEQADHTLDEDPQTAPFWWDHERPITNGEYSDVSLIFGALSILTAWIFGLGIIFGAAAVATGLRARRPCTPVIVCTNCHGIAGTLTGVAGVIFGIVFLTKVLPHII